MNLENDIFKKSTPDYKRLVEYGFEKEKEKYVYKKVFLDSFQAIITVEQENIEGKVIDLDLGEEYTNFRIENNIGTFANKVKEKYIELLIEIREKCFSKKRFISNQANRIADQLKEIYNDEPYYEWEDTPEYGVYKNKDTKKWYALFMNIGKDKLNDGDGKIDALNVKIEEKKIPELQKKDGFFPAYHMNKKYWITIALDERIKDREILELIGESYRYAAGNKRKAIGEWIVPANPKYYDIEKSFSKSKILKWKQSSNIRVEDIVYIYVGFPISALLYKTKARKVNIPYEYKDDNVQMNYVMELELLKKYPKEKCPFSKLKEFQVNAVRGPRGIPKDLIEYLEN